MKKIYLAIAYAGRESESVKEANRYAADLMKKGNVVFSPISQNHTIADQEDMPTGWKFWEAVDLPFIEWCDVLCVVPGWEKSIGVNAEIKYAKKLGKEIVFLTPYPDKPEAEKEEANANNEHHRKTEGK